MRIAAMILATLCLLAAGSLALVRSNTNFKDAKEMSSLGTVDKELVAMAKAAKIEGASVLEVKPAALKRGAVGFILTGLLSFALIVSMFVKKGTPILAGVVVGVAILTILLNPQYDTGALQAASARKVAIVLGIIAMVGAGFAFLSDRIRVRRAARA